jgi:hypothetical protein
MKLIGWTNYWRFLFPHPVRWAKIHCAPTLGTTIRNPLDMEVTDAINNSNIPCPMMLTPPENKFYKRFDKLMLSLHRQDAILCFDVKTVGIGDWECVWEYCNWVSAASPYPASVWYHLVAVGSNSLHHFHSPLSSGKYHIRIIPPNDYDWPQIGIGKDRGYIMRIRFCNLDGREFVRPPVLNRVIVY